MTLQLVGTLLGLAAMTAVAVQQWRRANRGAAAEAERAAQQEHLERQAMELEEQALELEQQVQELAESNAALVAAQAEAAEAHRRTVDEMSERMRQTTMFEAAMRTVPIAMAIIDRDLRYIRVNAATAAMTGVAIDQHPGRTLRDVNPLLAPALEAAFRRVIDTGEPCLNFRLTRPTPHINGGEIEIVMHITPFRDADGAIAGVCSTATDITAWRQLQHQFFQAQKLEAVGQLAAGIAHDFNNLLTVIASCCDLILLEMADNAPHREDIEEIRRASERATSLARRMLGTARSRTLVAKPVELNTVVMEARELMKRAVRSKVRLEVRCADGAGVVRADPSQLEQVLLNLVINAGDAIPDAGIVSVATTDRTLPEPIFTRVGEIPAGEYVELSVTDTGTGMDDHTLSRIFEPFFTTKGAVKGTGLGLATVFAIVRELAGGIVVASEVGKGTTFRIFLPHLTTEEDTGPRRARSAATAALPRGTETVLLVEDDEAMRTSVARLLSRQGFRVLEARHGGEALRVMAEHDAIDLVVSDLHMPGIDGYELSSRIRGAGRRMPVLFMSGSSGSDGIVAGLPDSADPHDRFISKPFEAEALLTTVREMIEPA